MKISKRHLQRIIREEYSRIKRKALIRENPNQIGDRFFMCMDKYRISQKQAVKDIAYQISGSDVGDQISDDYERETGNDPGYDGDVAVGALAAEMGFDEAVYYILDLDPSAEGQTYDMWERDAGRRR